MDDLIVFIFWVIIIAGAAIWKMLAKLLGSAGGLGKLAETSKRAKSLMDLLKSEDIEEMVGLPKKDGQPALARGDKPAAKVTERPKYRPIPPAPEAPTERPTPVTSLESERRRRARMRRKRAGVQAQAAAAPPPTKEKPVAEAPRREPSVSRWDDLLESLRSGGPARLREAIILREILDPPRALQGPPGLAFRLPPIRMGTAGIVATPARPPEPKAPADVPQHIIDMYRMGMLTRDQFEALCQFHRSRRKT